jgi:O-antigen/teichoic acid export membrane protein
MTPPAPHKSRHTDRQMAVRGSAWTLLGYGGSQILRLAGNLVLARLLVPEAFGIMALVNVFLQGLAMFSDVGIGPSIVQNKQGASPAFLRTAWTIQVVRGFGLGLATLLLAPLVAGFFAAKNPEAMLLASILPVVALAPVLEGFASTSLFTLNRKLRLGKITLVELLAQAAMLAGTLAWAWFQPSVWALVFGGLVRSATKVAASHALNRETPDGFGWDAAARRELLHFGRWVFLGTIATFLATHLDRILLGRLLSMGELGLYSIGMTFARVAIHTATRLSATVVFPLLAKRRDDPAGMVRACIQARAAVLWARGAVCVAFAVAAPFFFRTLYTDRYAGAGDISRWLALHVWAYVLLVSMNRLHLALGQPRVNFVANVVATVSLLLAVVGYRIAHLPGFIVGMACADLLAHLYLSLRLPSGRARMLRQSALATALVFACAAPAMGFANRFAGAPWWTEGPAVAVAAALPLLVAAVQVRRLLRARKEPAP